MAQNKTGGRTLIIDCHAHVSAPKAYWAYKAGLVSHRGSHGRGGLHMSDEDILHAWNAKEMAPTGHLDHMRACGIDRQCISPRPFQMMHSEKPAKIVHYWTEETNQVIHRSCKLMPDKFYGVAGLPQAAGEPIENALPELERCVKELAFKGCVINPDPYENGGTKAPPLGDRYWYPLYEKLCALDVVGHIHATGSREPEREPYTLHFINEETTAVYGLVNSTVLDDFPDLKILVSHGGGAMPFQLGRFDSASARGTRGRFRDRMRKLYYDTVLYTQGALELLIKTVGVDHVLYGAECPGVGSAINPDTGLTFDNIVPYIKGFDWLSDADKAKILENNARELFKL
jgi:4-oxalmesaconate hydratase/OH-DDVA meta-cleavage compound hydrolase